MKGFLFAIVIALLSAGSDPASAGAPYVSRVEAILFPNGEAGEMRRLHGDGIFLADPERIIVLDRHGRLVARSQRGGPMSLICRDRACFGYDHARGEVLELDPPAFRADGPIVPDPNSLSWETDQSIWVIEEGEEYWGFKAHGAGYVEWLVAELAFMRERVWVLIALATLGGVAASGALSVRAALISRRRDKLTLLARLALGVMGCAGVAAALLTALITAVLTPISTSAFLVGLSSGIILLVFSTRLLGRSTRSGRASGDRPLPN